MNPDTKLILDELHKSDTKWEQRFADLDAKWEARFGDADDTHEARIRRIEKVAAALESWQPNIEGTVDDLKLEVRKLNKHFERAVVNNVPPAAGIFPVPASASARPPAGSNADGPVGHREDYSHWEDGFGSVTTLLHPPVTGALPIPTPPLANSFSHQISSSSRLGAGMEVFP